MPDRTDADLFDRARRIAEGSEVPPFDPAACAQLVRDLARAYVALGENKALAQAIRVSHGGVVPREGQYTRVGGAAS